MAVNMRVVTKHKISKNKSLRKNRDFQHDSSMKGWSLSLDSKSGLEEISLKLIEMYCFQSKIPSEGKVNSEKPIKMLPVYKEFITTKEPTPP